MELTTLKVSLRFCGMFLVFAAQAAAQSTVSTARSALAVIEKHCLICHGATQMSGLDLRQRESALKGGTRGPALVAGKPDESLLYKAVKGIDALKMPPGKESLSPADIEILRAWIVEGAPWGGSERKAAEPSWWAFRKPIRPEVPRVQNPEWVLNPLDAFVLNLLEQKNLKPAPPADKRTLVRRAYFDLLGLPPTPKDIEDVIQDTSPDAYEKLIERLLSSPHYGERWGRHWLDVARYADSGGFETDIFYRNAWRYRDYVVKSFNDDKPYDRFLQEQIAGDELWPDDLDLEKQYKISRTKLEHLEARIGTGLYTLGPEIHESNMDARKLLNEKLTDAVDTTGAVFLGLTLGCARCHNHKFDPITQRDYYRLQAVFADSKEMETPVVMGMSVADYKQHYLGLIVADEARAAYRLFEERVRQRVVKAKKAGFAAEAVEAYEVPEKKRTPKQQELAEPLAKAISEIKIDDELSAEEAKEQRTLLDRIARAVLALPEKDAQGFPFDGIMDVPTASVLGHIDAPLVPEVYVLHRGDLGQEREKVGPGVPEVLGDSHSFVESAAGPFALRNRAKLALWLSQDAHPLTARVMVNRIWQWHFGRGIVSTPNDFGRQGQLPSHPQLLDWLATEFVSCGWSIKAMHRLVMLSNTYRMSSQYPDPASARLDPENRYLSRMNRRRLEGEAQWDSLHAIAGTLNLKIGGRPVTPPLAPDELAALVGSEAKVASGRLWSVSSDPAQHNRRGIYVVSRRTFPYPMFEAFDNPENAISCPERDVTTVSPQVLWFLNNRLVFQQAQHFAARLVSEKGNQPADWVERAWQLALGRPPSNQESQEALRLLDAFARKAAESRDWPDLPDGLRAIPLNQAAALTKLCLSVFNLSEFSYVD
ncbi:MAG: DUF1553 domain-containing protein [Acidimicrobiia bacterium]|nr:DUF1553 domain-containing protein [Acidimicrobiia bacterium]